jgi:hypothetical protein
MTTEDEPRPRADPKLEEIHKCGPKNAARTRGSRVKLQVVTAPSQETPMNSVRSSSASTRSPSRIS